MDLLTLVLLYFASLLPQHVLVVTDLQKQFGQFTVLLVEFCQSIVLVLQSFRLVVNVDWLGKGLRRNIHHFVICKLFSGPEVVFSLEVVELIFIINENGVLV